MAKQTKSNRRPNSKTAHISCLLRKPPSKKNLERGQRLAALYRLVIEKCDDGFIGATVEMPLVLGSGKTIEKCAENTLEATAVTIAVGLELGQQPPTPACKNKREVKLVVMVTHEEGAHFREECKRFGYARVSDFLREAGLRYR